MADISKIKLPSGSTYDLVDKKSGYKVVSINRKVDSGVNIADITIGDTTTQLYAPQGGGSGTITGVKTTAGAHTAIDVSSGAATFNVPTKTSHLTNDSGFVTTDQKLAVSVNDDDFSNRRIVFSSTSTTASTKNISNLLKFDTYSSSPCLQIGGTDASSNKKSGILRLYNSYGGNVALCFDNSSTATYGRVIYIPNKAGSNVTLATTDDIPTDRTKVQIVRW